jgi:hypothetical protein
MQRTESHVDHLSLHADHWASPLLTFSIFLPGTCRQTYSGMTEKQTGPEAADSDDELPLAQPSKQSTVQARVRRALEGIF